MDAQTSVVSDINNLIEIYGMFDSEILQGLPLFSKAAKRISVEARLALLPFPTLLQLLLYDMLAQHL